MNIVQVKKLCYSALLLAAAFLMPFLTGQIPQFGAMLCPMHIPVLLCGFVCGWQYGLAVGIIAPLFRSLVLGMPPMFPTAAAMSVELALYGSIAGLLYKMLPKTVPYIYASLLSAMILGRIGWGAAMLIFMGLGSFSFNAFIAGAILNSIPGIILQLVLVPVLVAALKKSKILLNE